MSDIRLSRTHSLSSEEREVVMSALIEYLEETLNATVKRSTGRITFKGKGYGGHVALDAGTVEGSVRLGVMMKPLKGVIGREIGKVLDHYLGAA